MSAVYWFIRYLLALCFRRPDAVAIYRSMAATSRTIQQPAEGEGP